MNPDNNPTPEQWETALDRALKKLPECQAPAALMPAVMKQIRARAVEPQSQRSWWQWPLALRIASGVALTVLLAGLVLFGGHFWETSASPLLNRSIEVAQTITGSLAGGMAAVFRVQPDFGTGTLRLAFVAVGLLLLVMYLTCIGIGTFVYKTVRK
jgi:hypothetical protein